MIFKIFKAIFAGLLYLLLAIMVLAVAGVILIAPRILFDPPWEWWMCSVLLGGIIAGIVFCVLFFRWYKRYLEIKKLEKVNQPQPDMDKALQADRIRRKWRKFMASLRNSCLKGMGDPIHALPWYIMLGDKGSAKSSIIESSGLAYELDTRSPEEDEEAGCEFWAMRDMVVLESGTVLHDSSARSSFSRLLDYIYTSRKKEPVNGVIVTVSAKQLLNGKQEELQAYAQNIRSMLEELMIRFSTQLPVYLFITKIDLLPGMRELSKILPEENLSQAMGCINEDTAINAGSFFEAAAAEINRQLKDLRLMLLYQNSRARPALMLAPDEINLLMTGLRQFVKGLFQENPYQHTPVARGLFLGSARTEGEAITTHLHELNIHTAPPAEAKNENEASKKSRPMFLEEFFSRIVPSDRNYYSPLPEFMRWESVKKNKNALALMAIITSLILLMSAAFMHTAVKFDKFKNDIAAQNLDQAGNDLPGSIVNLNSFISVLNKSKKNEADLWFDKFLLFNQPSELYADMQAVYAKRFENKIQTPLDKLINKNYPPFAKNRTGETLGIYYEYLIRTINLSRASGNSELSADKFDTELPPPTSGILFTIDAGVGPDIAVLLPELYKNYYLCAEGNQKLLERAKVQTGELITLLERGPDSLSWVTDWANTLRNIDDIRLQDFWGNDIVAGKNDNKWFAECRIKRANTDAGRTQILGLLNQMTTCIANAELEPLQRKSIDTVVAQRMQEFFSNYKRQTYDAWLCFARQLPRGKALLSNEESLRDYAGKSAVLAGPYMLFMDRCASELMMFASNDLNQLPRWMGLVLKIKAIRKSLPAVQMLGSSASKISQITSWAKNMADTVASKSGVPTRPVEKLRPENIFLNYCTGLWKSGPAPGNVARQTAYFNLSALFEAEKKKQTGPTAKDAAQKPQPPAEGNQSSDGGSAISIAYNAYNQLKNSLGGQSASDSEQVVWELIRGPFDLVLEYNCYETGRYLQSAWKGIVLNGIDMIPEVSRPEVIFKQESGRVWVWSSTVAAPFIATDSSGIYYPIAVFNKTIPFQPDFIEMLTKANKGAWGLKAQYAVNINALPIDVNPRAKTLPTQVMLTLNTSEGPQVLKNLNFPVARKYTWKPQEGGRTQLLIKFDGMSLIRTYEGPYGFAKFIRDFADGVHTFKPSDFPDSERMLENMCVSYIDIKYFFDPGEIEQLLLLNKLLDIKIPFNICSTFKQWRSSMAKEASGLQWQCQDSPETDTADKKSVSTGVLRTPQNKVEVTPEEAPMTATPATAENQQSALKQVKVASAIPVETGEEIKFCTSGNDRQNFNNVETEIKIINQADTNKMGFSKAELPEAQLPAVKNEAIMGISVEELLPKDLLDNPEVRKPITNNRPAPTIENIISLPDTIELENSVDFEFSSALPELAEKSSSNISSAQTEPVPAKSEKTVTENTAVMAKLKTPAHLFHPGVDSQEQVAPKTAARSEAPKITPGEDIKANVIGSSSDYDNFVKTAKNDQTELLRLLDEFNEQNASINTQSHLETSAPAEKGSNIKHDPFELEIPGLPLPAEDE